MIKTSKDAFGTVWLTVSVESPDPYAPDPLTDLLTEDRARQLIKELYLLFPSIESPAQALARGYKQAKKHIQFPVCACEFADDDETVIKPCLAHAEWAKNLKL